MQNMDVTDLRFEDGRFDVILCSHVLEHVIDDRKAMRELFRVLRPGGWAIIQSPTRRGGEETTLEDPTIVSPRERERVFGQRDHLRFYSRRDYVERLTAAGFTVTVDAYTDAMDEDAMERYGLRRTMHPIYFCAKATATSTSESSPSRTR
jgi:SAM-dependent methyltransferase